MNEQAGPGPRLNCAVILPKAPPAHWLPSFFSVTGRKAKAVYPCEAEHDSELSFQVGAIFNAGKCYRLHQSLTQNQPWHIGFGGKPNTQSDLQSNREMRRGEGERGGRRGRGCRRHRFALQCVWKRLDWALITLRGNEDFVVPIFCQNPLLWDRHYRYTIVFTEKHVVMSSIISHNALQFIGCFGRVSCFFLRCPADLSEPSPVKDIMI